MEWIAQKFRSPVWDEIKYAEDITTERLGTFSVRKYTFEREGKQRAFAEGHTRVADDWAMMYLSTLSGCPVGCQMCGTVGTLTATLSAHQMIHQIDAMMEGICIDETTKREMLIKWMYMGEPMLNPSEFISALRYILEKYPNWDHVISTTCPRADYSELLNVGKEYGDRIEFTISIHGLSEKDRNQIIPFRRKLTLYQAIELGEKWFEITGRKVSFSYNLVNSKNIKQEALQILELFDVDKWVPCIQFTHTINESKAFLENRTHEALCDEADATVDEFRAELESLGYDRTQGYYTNRDKLARGCGSLVEYQKYIDKKGIKRTVNL